MSYYQHAGVAGVSDYQKIARRYDKEKSSLWRDVVERPTFLNLLGDVRGLSALDLACGSGHFARLMRREGAAKVVGVDACSAMIALALEREAREGLGIEYRCTRVQELGRLDEFDVVAAAYLLNHASSQIELSGMLVALATNLRLDGRFVGLISAMDHDAQRDLTKYGLYAEIGPSPCEGQPFKVVFSDTEGDFDVVNYHWKLSTYEEAMSAAGLGEITWHRDVIVADDGAREQGYWDALAAAPPFIAVTARRVR